MGCFGRKGQVRIESAHLRRLHGALYDTHARADPRQERGLRLSLGPVRPPAERGREILEGGVRGRDGDCRQIRAVVREGGRSVLVGLAGPLNVSGFPMS